MTQESDQVVVFVRPFLPDTHTSAPGAKWLVLNGPTPATVLPLIREGRLKALALTSPQRIAELPQVPTFRELSLDALTLEFWAGLWGPAGLPPDVVEKLNGAINDSLKTPEMTESMGRLGFAARVQTVRRPMG